MNGACQGGGLEGGGAIETRGRSVHEKQGCYQLSFYFTHLIQSFMFIYYTAAAI